MGAPLLVKLSEKDLEDLHYNPLEIAKMEYSEGVIPMEVINQSAQKTEENGKN